MKKTARYETIDGYDVIYAIEESAVDPAASMNALTEALGISPEQAAHLPDYEQLFYKYAVYLPTGPGEKPLDPDEEADLSSKRAALREHEALTLEGEVIPDLRGAEYYLKTGDVWTEEKITAIGEALPEGAVQPDGLTEEQRKEISAQKEAERIAALTPEERAREEIARLIAEIAARDYRALKAVKLGKPLDDLYSGESEWYQGKLDRIHELEAELGE